MILVRTLLQAELGAIRESSAALTNRSLSDHTARALVRRDVRRQSTATAFLPPVNDDRPVDDPAPTALRRRRSLRASDVVAGAAVGGLLTLIALVGFAFVSRRHATATLTLDTLHAAEERWKSNGPSDYHMDVTVTGRQPSRYHVEVQDGKPIIVQRNDRDLDRRNWPYWTVPGLFDIIEHDIECAEDPTRGFGARPGSTAVLRADFDARLGYPRVFERLILGEPQLDMTWEVTRFEEGIGRQASSVREQ